MTEDEMVAWHHQLDGHEFKQAPGTFLLPNHNSTNSASISIKTGNLEDPLLQPVPCPPWSEAGGRHTPETGHRPDIINASVRANEAIN